MFAGHKAGKSSASVGKVEEEVNPLWLQEDPSSSWWHVHSNNAVTQNYLVSLSVKFPTAPLADGGSDGP